MTSDLFLIVGLGNPGAQYAATRHNIGQLALELLAARVGGSFKRHSKANAQVMEARLGGRGGVPGPRVVLVKPGTFMNTSGEPVASLAKYYGIEPQNVIALHDDVDLPFDSIRTKIGGGEGGHNGLRSMTKSLGTKDYYRVRLGVGRPPGRQDTADFVLGRFTKAELQLLPAFIDDAVDATMMLLTEGLLATQQRFHSKQDG